MQDNLFKIYDMEGYFLEITFDGFVGKCQLTSVIFKKTMKSDSTTRKYYFLLLEKHDGLFSKSENLSPRRRQHRNTSTHNRRQCGYQFPLPEGEAANSPPQLYRLQDHLEGLRQR